MNANDQLGDLEIFWNDDRVYIVNVGPGKTRVFELTGGDTTVTWNHDG